MLTGVKGDSELISAFSVIYADFKPSIRFLVLSVIFLYRITFTIVLAIFLSNHTKTKLFWTGHIIRMSNQILPDDKWLKVTIHLVVSNFGVANK